MLLLLFSRVLTFLSGVGVQEGDGDEAAATSSGVSALTGLMQTAGLSKTEAAEAVADVVNAMVVRSVTPRKGPRSVRDRSVECSCYIQSLIARFFRGAGCSRIPSFCGQAVPSIILSLFCEFKLFN